VSQSNKRSHIAGERRGMQRRALVKHVLTKDIKQLERQLPVMTEQRE
jgi:hypothetical protein